MIRTTLSALRAQADTLGPDHLQRQIVSHEQSLSRYVLAKKEHGAFPAGEGRRRILATDRETIAIAREDLKRYKWMLADWRKRHKAGAS